MRTFAILLFSTLLAGCPNVETPDPRAVHPDRLLSTDSETYRAGGSVTVVLTNHLEEQVGYNLCVAVLEEADTAGTWHRAPVTDDRVCTMELRILDPRESASFTHELPSELTTGTYRYSTDLEHMSSGVREAAHTNAFTVR
jgi:hypothetical protein